MIDHRMPMDVYRAHPGVSATDLKNIQRSPAYAKLRPSKPTPAKDFGSAVHTAILEPDQLRIRYGVDPEKPGVGGFPSGWRNTGEYKARRAERLAAPGIVGLLTQDQFHALDCITEQIRQHKIGQTLHALAGYREASVFSVDEDTGLTVKCRPDWLIPAARMVVDVKSAADHRPGPFAAACNRYGYHIGAAHYLDVLAAEVPTDHYVFLAVNSEPPYEIGVYTLDSDSLDQGRSERRACLHRWSVCVERDEWPAGTNEIEEIRIPQYAITFHEREEMIWPK